jgi:hypothetical protein
LALSLASRATCDRNAADDQAMKPIEDNPFARPKSAFRGKHGISLSLKW